MESGRSSACTSWQSLVTLLFCLSPADVQNMIIQLLLCSAINTSRSWYCTCSLLLPLNRHSEILQIMHHKLFPSKEYVALASLSVWQVEDGKSQLHYQTVRCDIISEHMAMGKCFICSLDGMYDFHSQRICSLLTSIFLTMLVTKVITSVCHLLFFVPQTRSSDYTIIDSPGDAEYSFYREMLPRTCLFQGGNLTVSVSVFLFDTKFRKKSQC